MTVASATGIVVGTVLVLKPGTSVQSQHRVTAINGAVLTVTPALPAAAANGDFIGTSWSDAAHLSTAGYQAFWYWVLRRNRPDGQRVIQSPTKIVLLADSWGALSTSTFPAAVAAAFPGATAVVSGVSGNKSGDLLARFDADVPTDADYVIFNEPGVNDAANSIDPATQSSNLEALLAKIRGIGATPILTGAVPLQATPTQSSSQSKLLLAQSSKWVKRAPAAGMGDVLGVLLPTEKISARSTAFGAQAQPALTTGVDNTALGQAAQGALTTGSRNTALGTSTQQFATSPNDNTALGYRAQRLLSTGAQNTAVGSRAQDGITTGGNNTAVGASAQAVLAVGGGDTAVGQQSQLALTTGGLDTAIGFKAQNGMTTGSNNTAVGASAQAEPAGVVGNATTTANRQTSVGNESGQSVATQLDDITTVGYRALAGDQAATAVGSGAKAQHARSVALGYASETTATDQVMVGARDIEITDTMRGVILRSPDGTRYRLKVANGGTLSCTVVS